jgi:D-alanyl-D-alanine carboxypeptidase
MVSTEVHARLKRPLLNARRSADPQMPTSFETAPPGNLSTDGRRMAIHTDRSTAANGIQGRGHVKAMRAPWLRCRRLAWVILAPTTCLFACSRATEPTPTQPALPGPASPFAPPLSPAPNAALAAGLDARITAEGEAFSGVVLVARDGVPIYQKAVGLADREYGRPNTIGTRFDLASLTKMFTGVAVLQLVQAEKVRLDAPLGTYLTDYPNQEVARKVTIHHLLTHTGGTGNTFGPLFAANRQQLRSLADYVALFGNRPPLFEPGSRWEYSNYGFVLLGLVIERVSGQSYNDFVAEHVFSPAGMTHTDFGLRDGSEDPAAGERAIGYTRRRPGQPPSAEALPNTSILPLRSTSAGGVYATAGDLLAFANALESHRLLDTKHTELLTTGQEPKPDGGKYAYGFSDAINDGQRCIGHSGGGPGMNAHLRICRAPGEANSHVVVVLTNVDPPTGQDLMRAAREALAPDR